MMKKLVYIFAALALFACEQADDFGQPNQGGTASGDLPEVIYATVADDDSDTTKTRTVVAEDGKTVLWNTGDAITYIGPGTHTAKYVYEDDDRVASATFTYKEETGSYPHVALRPEIPYAVYPYSSDAHCRKVNNVAVLSVNFPAEQTYAKNSFGRGASVMVGVGESADDTDFYFRNACGYLVIKLKGEGVTVKSITLTALGGEKIAGTGLITASHGAAPVVAMTDKGSSTITLNCGQGVALGAAATEFWFAMPPVTFEKGFKIFVTPTQGLPFEMQTSKEVEITRNDIRPMAALQFTANGQAPNQLTYTTKNNEKFSFMYGQPFDAEIAAHYYDDRTQKFIIECGAPIKVINDKAFKRLAGDVCLTSVSLPSQLETIGEYAFHLNDLQELVIPGSVTMIKDHAFRDNRLKRLTFLCGDEDLEIRDNDNSLSGSKGAFREAFFDYIYIDRNIRFKDDLGGDYAYVDAMAMFGHSGEDTFVVEFGPNVTTITESMFYGSKIQKLVIPGNITHIERNALTDIKSLEELVFLPNPDGTPLTIDRGESLGIAGPFYISGPTGDNLKTIRLNREINYTLDVIDSARKGLFSGRKVLETIEFGEQVKTLSDYMFASSAVLSSVNLPESVTSIGKYAFYDCTALTSINIPSQVTLIDEGTFDNCEALTSITIPSGITSIGKYAFRDCEVLSSISIPSNVQTIGDNAFENCIALTSVTVPSVTKMGNYVFEDCDALTTATLGANVIGIGVLYDCDALQTVTIKGTVLSIGNDAFYSCGAVKNLTFEPSPSSLLLTLGYQTHGSDQEGPFYDCPLETLNWNRNISYSLEGEGGLDSEDEGLFSQKANLTNVTIGNQVRTIPPYTFAYSGMTSITIPGSVNSIGDNAFDECTSLTSLTFEGSTTNLRLGFQPGTNDRGPFYDSPLTYINLNRQIDYIYDNLDATDEGVFVNANTSTPATVVFGENVKAIHNWMFYGVPVSSLTIPAGIDAIGKEAFGNNSRLTQVTCEGSTPANLDSEPFTSTNLQGIYIPSGSIDWYKFYWSRYQLYLREY